MNPSPVPALYVSALSWARVVKFLLFAGIVVSGLSIMSDGLALVFPPLSGDEELTDNPGGLALGLLSIGLALLTLVFYVATVVFFSMWLYRSYRNLPAFGTPRSNLNYSPGWAVGSFFVPFANLIIPYRAVKELWQNSTPHDENFFSQTSPPSWFSFWWGFWVVSNIVGNIYFRIAFNENISEEVVTVVGVISDSLSIVAALFAIVVVGDIAKRQEETSVKMKLGRYAGPPLPVAPMGFSETVQTRPATSVIENTPQS